MKLIFCFTLSLILGNFHVDSVAVAVDVVKTLENCNEEHKKTKFIDLNDDCVLLILEKLNYGDLLSVPPIDDRFSALAANVFRRKYSHLRVIVNEKVPFPDRLNELLNVADIKIDSDTIERISADLSLRSNKSSNVKNDENSIDLYDYESILSTFMHFGHEIKKLTARTYSWIPSWQAALIGYLISEYSSESIVDIKFTHAPDKLLNLLTKPLINVENVDFGQCFYLLETPIIGFGELFPALRRLYLDDLTHHDIDNFNCCMPHLEHVSMPRSKDSSPIENIIRKNPQIQSISLRNANSEFVQKLSTILPQLATLQLAGFERTDRSIQFENVTTFDTGNSDHTSPANLHFPRLRTVRIRSTSERFDEYLAFLKEHNHLSHLHLKGYQMDVSQFQQLTANLKDLVELILEHENNNDGIQKLSTNAVVEFLESHDKVKQLRAINFNKYWIADLQECLKHEWNARFIDNGLSFERK